MWLSYALTGRIIQSAGNSCMQASVLILDGGNVNGTNLINKCRSPVPQLSEIMMILRVCEQSDADSAGQTETHMVRPEERELPHFLKGLCLALSTVEQRDKMLIYFNKNHVPRNSLFPDQRANHLHAADSHTLIIKKQN